MLVLLLACASSVSVDDTSSGKERPEKPDTGFVDTGVENLEDTDPWDTASVVTEESAPPFDEDVSAWMFTLDRIHEVEITLSAEAEAALGASPYEWAPGTFSFDGEELGQVGVRLRGKIGSFRTLSGKPKFKISFGEYARGQTFYGLKELSLNNSAVDCSYMKEVVGFRIYEAAGVPHLRTSYTRVTVNGADYGLYIVVETPNDVWLERHFADASGNLYDGKYVWYGGYSYTLLDFGDNVDSLFQLEEGTDIANADIAAVSAALLASQGTATFHDTTSAVVDWPAFHKMTAVDQFIGHNDGYSMNTNNYRVYFDPADGKAELLPWDLDYSFLLDYQWGLSWSAPRGNLTHACWLDATCVTNQRQAMADFLTAYEATDWTVLLDQIEALTYADTQSDPRRECSAADVQPNRDYVRTWLDGKPSALRMWWGI